ncbi:MAG: Hpt domain-containing protein [Sulfitobacter sp.]
MIDWERIKLLCDDVGPEDFEDVVEVFFDEVTGMTDSLRVAPNIDTLGADLHALKGSALNLGFITFSELCQTGETLAGHGRAAEIDLRSILESFDLSMQAFREGMHEGAVA